MPEARAVEATAPCRVDLAGGTLDIWPLYLFHPGALTVNVAIDRRAWCRVETGLSGVRIESKDTLTRVEGRDVSEVLAAGGLSLVAHVLRALGIESGVRVVTQSRVPAGSGLGGSSALAVAIAGAAARAVGRELPADELWPLVRDAEARSIAVPTGVQDYHAALRGGVNVLRLEPGRLRVERSPADPARVEECLLLVDAGGTRFSGLNQWEVFRARMENRDGIPEAFAAIADVATRVAMALARGDFGALAHLIAEEWEARKRMAAGITTPEIDRIAATARRAGAGAKVCGAGGGGVVAVWAAPGARGPGAREAVQKELAADGFRVFPARVDLRGLEVEDVGV